MTPHPQPLARTAVDPLQQIADIRGAITAHAEPAALLGMLDGIAECIASLASQNAHLEFALNTNRRVGAAMGILMIQHRIAEDAAFLLLRNASQRSHRKLRDVADDVVRTGEMPVGATDASARVLSPLKAP